MLRVTTWLASSLSAPVLLHVADSLGRMLTRVPSSPSRRRTHHHASSTTAASAPSSLVTSFPFSPSVVRTTHTDEELRSFLRSRVLPVLHSTTLDRRHNSAHMRRALARMVRDAAVAAVQLHARPTGGFVQSLVRCIVHDHSRMHFVSRMTSAQACQTMTCLAQLGVREGAVFGVLATRLNFAHLSELTRGLVALTEYGLHEVVVHMLCPLYCGEMWVGAEANAESRPSMTHYTNEAQSVGDTHASNDDRLVAPTRTTIDTQSSKSHETDSRESRALHRDEVQSAVHDAVRALRALSKSVRIAVESRRCSPHRRGAHTHPPHDSHLLEQQQPLPGSSRGRLGDGTTTDMASFCGVHERGARMLCNKDSAVGHADYRDGHESTQKRNDEAASSSTTIDAMEQRRRTDTHNEYRCHDGDSICDDGSSSSSSMYDEISADNEVAADALPERSINDLRCALLRFILSHHTRLRGVHWIHLTRALAHFPDELRVLSGLTRLQCAAALQYDAASMTRRIVESNAMVSQEKEKTGLLETPWQTAAGRHEGEMKGAMYRAVPSPEHRHSWGTGSAECREDDDADAAHSVTCETLARMCLQYLVHSMEHFPGKCVRRVTRAAPHPSQAQALLHEGSANMAANPSHAKHGENDHSVVSDLAQVHQGSPLRGAFAVKLSVLELARVTLLTEQLFAPTESFRAVHAPNLLNQLLRRSRSTEVTTVELVQVLQVLRQLSSTDIDVVSSVIAEVGRRLGESAMRSTHEQTRSPAVLRMSSLVQFASLLTSLRVRQCDGFVHYVICSVRGGVSGGDGNNSDEMSALPLSVAVTLLCGLVSVTETARQQQQQQQRRQTYHNKRHSPPYHDTKGAAHDCDVADACHSGGSGTTQKLSYQTSHTHLLRDVRTAAVHIAESACLTRSAERQEGLPSSVFSAHSAKTGAEHARASPSVAPSAVSLFLQEPQLCSRMWRALVELGAPPSHQLIARCFATSSLISCDRYRSCYPPHPHRVPDAMEELVGCKPLPLWASCLHDVSRSLTHLMRPPRTTSPIPSTVNCTALDGVSVQLLWRHGVHDTLLPMAVLLTRQALRNVAQGPCAEMSDGPYPSLALSWRSVMEAVRVYVYACQEQRRTQTTDVTKMTSLTLMSRMTRDVVRRLDDVHPRCTELVTLAAALTWHQLESESRCRGTHDIVPTGSASKASVSLVYVALLWEYLIYHTAWGARVTTDVCTKHEEKENGGKDDTNRDANGSGECAVDVAEVTARLKQEYLDLLNRPLPKLSDMDRKALPFSSSSSPHTPMSVLKAILTSSGAAQGTAAASRTAQSSFLTRADVLDITASLPFAVSLVVEQGPVVEFFNEHSCTLVVGSGVR